MLEVRTLHLNGDPACNGFYSGEQPRSEGKGSRGCSAMEAWLIGIGSGIIAAALLAFCKARYQAIRDLRGPLSGDWYQITYDPEDANKIWSVEWIEVKHHGDFLRGTMWRIFPRNFDRRWAFEGRRRDSSVISVYWADRGEGGDGTMSLLKATPRKSIGRFWEYKPSINGNDIHYGDFSAPIQWVRTDGETGARVLEEVRKVPEPVLRENLPRRILKRVQRLLRETAE